MNNITIIFKEFPIYKLKIYNALKFNAFIAIFILIIVTIASNLIYGIIISFFFYSIQLFKSYRWHKYFIMEFKVDAEKALIRYREKNNVKEITGNKNDFKVNKNVAFNQTKTNYVTVYYKGNLIIKQFPSKEWTENILDKLVKEFQK